MSEHCPKCGSEIVHIELSDGRVAVCDADSCLYWMENPNRTVITPNGEEVYASLYGEIKSAFGIARPIHSCGR